eukprot:NODE_2980_length_432_cov_440.417755_g2476_i0.p1 GENE.NODE_2980_length_432_cov_440.417755_g2476_i0~~NODE_2980_length_432_cov_440.417755_g2476_i0.p1  ORF type:complete len:107 (+),score=35.73 NODE_2980_length_432_cov_440.417755_g2476_i0:28-321(+)
MGDDLVFVADITLEQALCGFEMTVESLDGRLLRVFIDEVVHPQYVRVVEREGMPGYGDRPRGNLLIEFRTSFPSYLTADQKKEIGRILTMPATATAD